MDRRKFLSGITVAGATTLSAKTATDVSWKVKGFTCITCAVGLETMLRGMKGVERVRASYPENKVSIGYDKRLTSEATLRAFIKVCGFQVYS